MLHCLAQGMSNRETAAHLVISVSTVQNHLHRIFTKLEARSRTRAVLFAQQRGYCRDHFRTGEVHLEANKRHPDQGCCGRQVDRRASDRAVNDHWVRSNV